MTLLITWPNGTSYIRHLSINSALFDLRHAFPSCVSVEILSVTR